MSPMPNAHRPTTGPGWGRLLSSSDCNQLTSSSVIYAGLATVGSSSASSASMGEQPLSIFTVARSSPRVRPRLMIAIGMPSAAAWRTNRYPEYTVSDDPATSSASAPSTSEYASSTRAFGTFSPKYTMSGLSIPPQYPQSMV